ncbi:hypothetical protein [Streptomyces sp. MST-110588]|uniref:hypothetical protein n=1 Tax=Streptomyces sp. MST-110588 TaxID=2833628 RepID=UPI001F5CA84D|nr:hypothetical protein [Streptomyces sp. MST-110588]UNO38450.1 hypothetical protein KGS77_00775 [Streptomyces sp. MST-110588]
MRELDGFEDELIERFKEHPVLANIPRLPDEDFAAILLQRRFVSLAFTPSYDLAIDLLRDEVGLRIARTILREEYPDSHGNTRSHREDMKEDLLQLGISRRALVETKPTEATKKAINDTFELIADAGARDADADVRLLTILRFWGEVLVSVEYGRLWERIGPLLTRNGENRSRFYYPHYVHDAKAHPLATVSLLSTTHSDRLATRLSELLARQGSTACFREAEERSLQLKTRFYDQFLLAPDRVGT